MRSFLIQVIHELFQSIFNPQLNKSRDSISVNLFKERVEKITLLINNVSNDNSKQINKNINHANEIG
jgi:hypothetical protein